MGDINARIPDLSTFDEPVLGVNYRPNPDNGSNSHGHELVSICKNMDLLPLNCLDIGELHFDGGLTYRQGPQWKSQIDWILCSKSCLGHINSFDILNGTQFPSNHAPVTVTLTCSLSSTSILERARLINEESPIRSSTKKTMRFHQIDVNKLLAGLPSPETLFPYDEQSAASLCETITNTLLASCLTAKKQKSGRPLTSPRNALERWANLLEIKDSKVIWQAINWKGNYKPPTNRHDTPSDEDFAKHFHELLNPPDKCQLTAPQTDTYVPVLDDPITPFEVDTALKRLQISKSAGPDGIPPGVLKYLPDDWICLLTFLFNLIFIGSYPKDWCFARFVAIFKKGDPQVPANYRGISILSALSKLYDSILHRRFIQWYQPCPEQAGAQENRGCPEQILCPRLLIDCARKARRTLYIAFIDYAKAYDRVNRQILLQLLANRGCGQRFLQALTDTLSHTANIISSTTFETTGGVRQGGPSSCSLFAMYVDEIVKAINCYGNDGFLGKLHCLLLMDDTAIVASSRQAMQQKLNSLLNASNAINMKIHPEKSQYITVNSADTEPFHLFGQEIKHTRSYTYLGTPISNGTTKQQIQEHIAAKQCHVRKFLSFLSKNADAPFCVKKTVWDSALSSAIYYSAESWLIDDLSIVRLPYLTSAKALLGVRLQTPTDLVYLELGVPSAESMVRKKQLDFIRKTQQASTYAFSPLKQAVDLSTRYCSPMALNLKKLLNTSMDPVHEFSTSVKTRVLAAETSRVTTYKSINPDLTPHAIYGVTSPIPEPYRIALTRFRLSSHYLKIETGRWSRIPREERWCVCREDLQTEEHVLLNCPRTLHIRRQFAMPTTSLNDVMNFKPESMLCKFVFCVLKYFANS
jgi:hypothetical protein